MNPTRQLIDGIIANKKEDKRSNFGEDFVCVLFNLFIWTFFCVERHWNSGWKVIETSIHLDRWSSTIICTPNSNAEQTKIPIKSCVFTAKHEIKTNANQIYAKYVSIHSRIDCKATEKQHKQHKECKCKVLKAYLSQTLNSPKLANLEWLCCFAANECMYIRYARNSFVCLMLECEMVSSDTFISFPYQYVHLIRETD